MKLETRVGGPPSWIRSVFWIIRVNHKTARFYYSEREEIASVVLDSLIIKGASAAAVERYAFEYNSGRLGGPAAIFMTGPNGQIPAVIL